MKTNQLIGVQQPRQHTARTSNSRNCRHASRRAVRSAGSRRDVGTGRVAGARGSRTHRPGGSTGTNDFEDRRAHRSPSAPIISTENIGQVWTARVPLPDSLRGGRLGAQDRVHGSLELPSRHCAHDLVYRTAALEDQQRGNTPDAVLQGRLGI